ncbi:MAG: hypothetical protein HY858_09070 [Candidatus Solibacter usitatus]|nr:hypothetical protein [Candidatus Solibacter usitatus]
MKRHALIQLLKKDGQSDTQAADELDRAVEHILKRLKKGQTVALPGLGRLVPGRKPAIRFEKRPVRPKGPARD